jgi:hypothetical protein
MTVDEPRPGLRTFFPFGKEREPWQNHLTAGLPVRCPRSDPSPWQTWWASQGDRPEPRMRDRGGYSVCRGAKIEHRTISVDMEIKK